MNSVLQRLGAATLLFVLTACSGGLSVEEHIARANQFLTVSDYDSAIIELKNALQKESQSAQARWLLGKVYLESGDVLSAEKELDRAQRLGWSQNDLIPVLAESLLAQGKYAEVRELDEKGLQPQAEASLLAVKALAEMGLGEHHKALELVDKALDRAPQSTGALLAKARILAGQGDWAGTDTVLDVLLSLDPDDGAAWILVGDVRLGRQQPEEALAAYDKALALQPQNYGAIFKRALLSVQLQNYEAAQVDTSKLLRIAPQHPGANYLQGVIYFQAGRYSEAITALSVAEPAFKQFPLVLFFLGSAQLVEGNLEMAGVKAAHFASVAPQSIRGRKLLAVIRLQQGEYAQVQELLRPVLDAAPDDVAALNLMSNALLRDGKSDEGITLLSRVAELQPDSPVAQVRLGAGLLLGGKGDDAAQHMEAALELNPEFQQADILLVMNHVQNQDFPAAIEAAQAYRRRNLTSTTPLNLLGRVYQAAGQPDKARESYEKALKFDAGDPGANHNLAQMAIANEDLVVARLYYVTLLVHHDNYLPALIQLALLDAREQDHEALVAHLEQAIGAHPDAIEPRLLLGRYQLSEGRPEKVAPLFASLPELQKQSPQVLQLMALAQLSGSEHTDAQYTLEQLMASTPDTAALRHLMAMAASGTGDAERSEQELRRALELDENYLPSRIALARMALAAGRTGELDRHLEKLESLAPGNPDVLLLQAASANSKGDAAAAIKLAGQAYKSARGTATVRALAAYKEAAGDYEGARELYRAWLAENAEDVAVRMMIANNLQVAQEVEEAKTEYEQLLQFDPDNVVALNNLAWHYRQEQPARALEYARHASRLAPDRAEVLDTLAVVQYINKDYKQALRNVERALRQRPDNPSMLYHRAMISAATGDNSRAVTLLEKLLDSGADFPEQDEANALLVDLRK